MEFRKYNETCRRCGEVFETNTRELETVCDRCQWEEEFERERERECEFPGESEEMRT
jgi:hypothetical protein